MISKMNLRKKEKSNKGITLIALVITIIVLLILAAVSISTLMGENGILNKSQQTKTEQIKAEMREQLMLVILELQTEKQGKATLNDITDELIVNKLKEYEGKIIDNTLSSEYKKIQMNKQGIIANFIIESNLNITEKYIGSIEFSYIVGEREGNIIKISVRVQDEENGLDKIEFTNGEPIIKNGTKEEEIIQYEIELGKEYEIIITSTNQEVRKETILIDKYYYTITKKLGEGISIDNIDEKVEYNKPYTAMISTEENYVLENIKVTMAGETIEVDKSIGKIEIENVIGDIEIIVESKRYGLLDYWKLTEDLKNSVTNTAGDLVVCKGDNPQFSEDGVFLDNIVLSTQRNYEIANTFSMIFQIKATKINTWSNVVGKHIQMIQDCRATGLWMWNSASNPIVVTGNKSYIVPGKSLYKVNELTTIAITHTGNVLTVYSNGVKIASTNCSNTPITSRFFIGGSAASGNYVTAGYSEGYSPGYYKNVAIYNRTLSDDEIANYTFEQ